MAPRLLRQTAQLPVRADGTARYAVVADTHSAPHPGTAEVLRRLAPDAIVHAGDIGDLGVLEDLAAVAPVFAIRGNIDTETWAQRLPAADIVEVGKLSFYVLHNIADLDLDLPTAGFAAVVYGHSHQPSLKRNDGVLYLNPGSAGPRRFRLPVTLARVAVAGTELTPEIVELRV